MELVASGGSKIRLENRTEVGRYGGFYSDDRTISRRHAILQLKDKERDGDVRVSFEAVGKNPILVVRNGGTEKRVFRTSEKGELSVGDQLSLSLKNPVFYTLKKVGVGEEEEEEHERKRVRESVERSEMETLEGEETGRAAGLYGGGTTGREDLEAVSIDLSQIDPVKDFGFLLKGEEFNHYPKQKILDVGKWNWFINDTNGGSEDDDARSPKGRKHKRRKDKKIDDDGDEDWTGESEVDMASVKTMRNPKRSKFCVTRSRDRKKAFKANGEKSNEQKTVHLDNEEEEEQERGEDDEETLSGFIVSDVEEPEEFETDNLDEEEEFDDEEEEFDDEDGESDDDVET